MVYKGSRTGVGGQLISLLGWLALVFCSIGYYQFTSEAIFGFLLQRWARPISFAGIAMIVFVIVKISERVFSTLAGEEELPPLERIGGVIVACARAALFFGVISILLLLTPVQYLHNTVIRESKAAMYFVKFDATIYSWLSEHMSFAEKRSKDELIGQLTSQITEEG